MKLIWGKNDIKTHLEDEPIDHKDLVVLIRHVGDGDDGNCWEPPVRMVTHTRDAKTGQTYMEIFIDASRSTVRN